MNTSKQQTKKKAVVNTIAKMITVKKDAIITSCKVRNSAPLGENASSANTMYTIVTTARINSTSSTNDNLDNQGGNLLHRFQINMNKGNSNTF